MMKNSDWVSFLQWALPRLHMRWPGFRKVRRQVTKRIARRMRALQLADVPAYRRYLDENPREWAVLDGLCCITVSRFYRDRGVYTFLAEEVLPIVSRGAIERGTTVLRAWSAGCGAGEEPYTLSLIWQLRCSLLFPDLDLRILATDLDENNLGRARRACYPASSLKALPEGWRDRAFAADGELYCLKSKYKQGVQFLRQDLRAEVPAGPFDLIFCRNLVFTYFDQGLQLEIGGRMFDALTAGGILVIGIHEALPGPIPGFKAWSMRLGIYQKPNPSRSTARMQ
jgi:chemotaxis protein methyltransferase CheR